MRFMLLLSALGAVFLTAGCSRGAPPATVGAISPDSLHAWMEEGRPLLLLDLRPREEFDRRHLPGATPAAGRSVPELAGILPADPDVPLVVYGDIVPADQEAPDLADEAAGTYGFPHVYRLEGGLEAWARAGYDLDGRAVLDGSP